MNPLTTLNTAVLASGACRGLPNEWFFPEREEGADNHGADAKAACALCPVRTDCLRLAVERNEPVGIWGGAGEARRRQLRRVQSRPGVFEATMAAHFAQLDGAVLGADQRLLLASFGAGAVHGKRCTQAKGCRCEPCKMAASFEGVVKAMKVKPKSRGGAGGAVAA